MRRSCTKKAAFRNALVWTVAATLALLSVMMGKNDVLQVLVALLFALNAGIWWRNYIKQQEEENHD